MRTLARFLVVAFLIVFSTSGHVPAITNGVPDGSDHPNAGYGLAYFASLDRFGRAQNGVLVAPDVVLVPWWQASGFQAFLQGGFPSFIGFGSAVDPNGTDPLLFEIDHVVFDIPHGNLGSGLGVLILKQAVSGITPAQLPPVGRLDDLRDHNGLHDQAFTVVGYGSEGRLFDGAGMPVFQFTRAQLRMETTAGFMALGPRDLIISTNSTLGNGGGCHGDGGAPMFLGASNEVVAVWADIFDSACRAMNAGFRTDTPAAHAFLSQFPQITLP